MFVWSGVYFVDVVGHWGKRPTGRPGENGIFRGSTGLPEKVGKTESLWNRSTDTSRTWSGCSSCLSTGTLTTAYSTSWPRCGARTSNGTDGLWRWSSACARRSTTSGCTPTRPRRTRSWVRSSSPAGYSGRTDTPGRPPNLKRVGFRRYLNP